MTHHPHLLCLNENSPGSGVALDNAGLLVELYHIYRRLSLAANIATAQSSWYNPLCGGNEARQPPANSELLSSRCPHRHLAAGTRRTSCRDALTSRSRRIEVDLLLPLFIERILIVMFVPAPSGDRKNRYQRYCWRVHRKFKVRPDFSSRKHCLSRLADESGIISGKPGKHERKSCQGGPERAGNPRKSFSLVRLFPCSVFVISTFPRNNRGGVFS